MRNTLLAASAIFVALAGAASAQTTIVTQEPVVTQEHVIVQDPVVTNSTVVMPGQVRTYVMDQRIESEPYDGDVLVGRVLPEAVEVRPVAGYDNYGYTVVNEHRVIVNPQTRAVIQVLD